MPDIAMCVDKECPSKEKCFRFSAKPSRWQSYMETHRKKDAEKCHWFYPMKYGVEDNESNS